MDRRTRKHLAQVLQQQEQLGVDATTQPSPLVDRIQPYIAVLDRLTSVRRVDPTPRLMAAGQERLLSALSAAPQRGRGFSSLFLTPVLRSAAIVLGLVVLTGAAAGTSWALGGPNIWPGKADRDSDRAIERSEDNPLNIDPAGSESSTDTGSGTLDDGSGGAEQASSGDDNDGQAGPISDDPGDDMMVGEEPEGTGEPEDEAGPEDQGEMPAGPTQSADDGDEAEDDGSDKQSVDIETDVAPTPLQYRLNMAYDDNVNPTPDGGQGADPGGQDGEDSLNNTAAEESAAEGPTRPAAAQSPPGQAMANANAKGPGQNGQQHSGR